ncbi:hypothetical protein N7468_005234 [Penicillium chermesinum]|uniref:Rhodopsin domain-containing protein n=1 Tax=Penicillium chermesinum TaxID=63820 RepID=A0A9W9NYT3_9EURO|nr:uncharacterized protein N7468_005234 [Penicillium chermesinum]KAJ5232278.1 hypothetical protein N7468_005234 [Penicillium chermesinum]
MAPVESMALFGRAVNAAVGKHVNTSVQTADYWCQGLCIAGMTICYFLRLYTRLFILRGFHREDWLCTAAYILGTAYSVIALLMGKYGGGLHLHDVPKENLTAFKKTVYVTLVMYGPTAYLTKVCLLWIMARVFSPFRKAVIFIYIFMGVMLAYYIPSVIVKVRICLPINSFWDSDVKGSCLNENAIITADAVISSVSDLIILIVPLPLTMSLQMAKKKKLRVVALMGAGGMAVLASVIRLVLIVLTSQSADTTMAFMRINMLGNAEIAIGVICTCLPAVSALLKYVAHEYSSGKDTDYKLSTMQTGNTKSVNRHQMKRTSVRIKESDEDVLVSHAQGDPRIETSINGEREGFGNHNQNVFQGGIGVTRTIEVSSSVDAP